ncbi:NeuD/PglB/VioB family sugar acetyltransferase [Bacillus sp. AK128]
MKILIVGAGGHGRSVYSIIENSFEKYNVVAFVDKYKKSENEHIYGKPILTKSIEEISGQYVDHGFILALGDNQKRKECFDYIIDNQLLPIYGTYHRTAIIDNTTIIDNGVVISAGAILCTMSHIGCNTIINSGAIIEHESVIGKHCHIGPGVKVGGRVNVGDSTFLGIGSVVKDNVSIGSHVIVGAGSVVVNDIPDYTTVVGVPGRIIKDRG